MLKSFFWMCSGADPDLLSESPKSEQIKYAGIGGTVFFTAIMAFVAASYALYTVFDSVFLSIGFGLLWGLLIFNLDRFIVSTIKKRDNKFDELLQASPRIILAVIIAVVISKPLEIKIFEKEIDQVLLTKKNEMQMDNQNQVAALYADEIAKTQEKMSLLDQYVINKEAEVNKLYDTYIAEAEGRAGTGLLGKGPVYEEKREKHDLMLAELQDIKQNAIAEKAELKSSLLTLEKNQKDQTEAGIPIIAGFDGLMARVNALGELPWLPSFFIFLLFLAIETSPILAKLLSPRGSYDYRYADSEQKVALWAMQNKLQRENLLAADTEITERVYQSLKKEDEVYHYKKQKARALIHFQADAFVKEQGSIM